MMQLRSIALTKRPIAIEVQGGRLETIEFRASVRFWPADKKFVALFHIEFDELPSPQVLAECGITLARFGAYVYLNVPNEAGEFVQTIRLPKATVRRIKIHTWDWPHPIVLDNMTVTATGAEVASEYAVRTDIVLNDFDDFKLQARPVMLGLNLMTHRAGCSAACHAITRNWYETMDDIGRRYSGPDVGRVNCSFEAEAGVTIPVTVINGTPAMLRIPRSHAEYLEKIGDKARNMIRKAQRQGYEYRLVDPDAYLDDVLEIRTSDPERQGKQIPEYYRRRPERMIDEPFRSGCGVHGEHFYGLFKDGKLCAYTTIFFYGELGQVNHILGHADHLKEGVMNLLASEMVREVIERKPWVRGINYLYPHGNAKVGIGLFKRNIGFLPERVVTTESAHALGSYFADPDDAVTEPVAEAPSEKKILRASTSKAVKAVASDLTLPATARNRAHAHKTVLHTLSEQFPALNVVRKNSQAGFTPDELDASAVHAVVFEDLALDRFKRFLSTDLKGLRMLVPKGSFLLFDFRRVLDRPYSPERSGLARLLFKIIKADKAGDSQELLDYLLKRFKSMNLSVDEIKNGFKGTDYVVAGVVDYEGGNARDPFDSLLVLRKIR